MSVQKKENQCGCMSSHKECVKIAVTIDSGASGTVASVDKFGSYPVETTTASDTTYASAAGKQAEDIVNVVRGTFESSTITARRSGPSSRCAEDMVRTRYWEASADWWILDTPWYPHTRSRAVANTTPMAAGRTRGSRTGLVTSICG